MNQIENTYKDLLEKIKKTDNLLEVISGYCGAYVAEALKRLQNEGYINIDGNKIRRIKCQDYKDTVQVHGKE